MISDDRPPDVTSAGSVSRKPSDIIKTPPRKLKPQRKSDISEENWDEDFASKLSPKQTKMRSSIGGSESLRDRMSFEKDSNSSRTPRRDLAEGLRAWSESPTSVRHRTPGLSPKQEENWDDDFADHADSPARASTSRNVKKRRQSDEVENWDDEFGIQTDPGSPRQTTIGKRLVQELNWESSDDEEINDRELGFDKDDEDKTVTSKARRKPLAVLNRGNPPPLPPIATALPTIHAGGTPGTYSMPSSPFPKSSPNHSVFSIPATITSAGGRESTIADSTAHFGLRRTYSAESNSPIAQTFSSRYGPSSPPRERRRLRKKSRPSHLDSSILELDDKPTSDMSTPPPFSSTTPEERPGTPPFQQSSVTGGLLSPVTPSSAMSPLSPSSKSPLLQRITSVKKWGSNVRKMRISTGADSGPSTSALSPKLRSPPTAFHAALDTERRDLNRTPRPHSYIAPSTRPISSGREAASPNATPSRAGRFFRSSSREMDKQASQSRPSLHESLPVGPNPPEAKHAMVLKERKSRDQERLRVVVPLASAMSTAASSQSGDSELSHSPRRARIRAFGQKLLSGSGVSRAHSPDSAHGTNSSDGGDSRRSSIQYNSTPPSIPTPLSGETPTRLKPRIPPHAPASLRVKGVFPRHVSGSAVQDQERKRQLRAKHPLQAPAMGRSISASTVNTAVSSEDAGHSGADSGSQDSHGYRHFMGSMRRISLTSSRSKRDGSSQSTPDKGSKAPELPSIPLDSESFSKQPKLLSLQTVSSKSEGKGTGPSRSGAQKSPAIDLASPKSTSSPLDWGAPPPPPSRLSKEGVPILTHSKSSSFATGTTSSSKSASTAGTVVPGRIGTSASHAASLSRATSPIPSDATSMHRRNSLGDLKIPSRISRAQDGLKRDLGRVREFASCVEQMIDLRSNYFNLASRIHDTLESSRPASRASIASPTSIFRSSSRARSHTSPQPTNDHRTLAIGFQRIDAKYAIAWECADLLIELGTGQATDPVATAAPSQNSSSQGTGVARSGSWRGKNRERAVTLAGDEGKPDLPTAVVNGPPPKSPGNDKPPPNVSWRASTGRHDLGHRQLYLLKEMLSNTDSGMTGAHLDISPELCRLKEGLESNLTLPTDESAASGPLSPSKVKKSSKLGMIGIRDMLRSLKRKTTQAMQQPEANLPAQSSTTLNTTESGTNVNGRKYDNHPYNYNTVAAIPVAPSRRKSETSAALQMHMADPSFSSEAMMVSHKSSPRRPSLASLFRIGQKHRSGGTGFSVSDSKEHSRVRPGTTESESANRSGEISSRSSMDDSDWDRMDSMSDLEHQLQTASNGAATNEGVNKVAGKLAKKKRLSQTTPPRPSSPNSKLPISRSQASFATPDQSVSNFRSGRLSNVEENDPQALALSTPTANTRRPQSKGGRERGAKLDRPFSSVRTLAHQPSKSSMPSFDAPNVHALPDLKLAMTPENIKPLLENAKVVTTRLIDCLSEVRGLLLRVEGSAADIAAASVSNVNIMVS